MFFEHDMVSTQDKRIGTVISSYQAGKSGEKMEQVCVVEFIENSLMTQEDIPASLLVPHRGQVEVGFLECEDVPNVKILNGKKIKDFSVGMDMVFLNFEDGTSASIARINGGDFSVMYVNENRTISQLENLL